MLIFSNQVTEVFNQRYLKKKYICPSLIFFHADRHINNKKTKKSFFMLNTTIPKALKK